jgi:hypothetical protein
MVALGLQLFNNQKKQSLSGESCPFPLVLAATCGGFVVPGGLTTQVQIQLERLVAETTSHSLAHAIPCTLQINRSDEFVLTVVKSGCRIVHIPSPAKLANVGGAEFATSVILGRIVEKTVVTTSGATMALVPDGVIATLNMVRPGLSVRTIRRTAPTVLSVPVETAARVPSKARL